MEGQGALFAWVEQLPVEEQPDIRHGAWLPVWSRNKARLVAEYLRLFLMVTKNGTYIDGFAGPQADDDCWSARRVLEVQPQWLGQFHLCDKQPGAVARLLELRAAHPDRDVQVHGPDDFNLIVDDILSVIPRNKATFCLLDQRTFECQWETVVKLARFKSESPYKIELFYFLANFWLDRALVATRTKGGREAVTRWWGSPAWELLRGQHHYERAQLLARRFREELHYRFAVPYELYDREGGAIVMFYMIHATDHPGAPDLMARAYRSAVGDPHALQLPLFPAEGDGGKGHLVPGPAIEDPASLLLPDPAERDVLT